MRRILMLTILALAVGLSASRAEAQTPIRGLDLRLSKLNGFSMGGQIEGKFRLTASGSADIQRVTFSVDGAPIGDVTASPFRITFDTGTYAVGRHELSATGVSASGETLLSNVLTVKFLSAGAGRKATLQIIVPVLAIVLVAGALATLGPLLGLGRRRPRRLGEYGMAGGAVCPRCGQPFSRHLMTLRLLGKRLERCPHCGKWSFAERASPERLAQAEARQRDQQGKLEVGSDDQESFRRMIDDSRFDS
jgi:ribosomal protein L32